MNTIAKFGFLISILFCLGCSGGGGGGGGSDSNDPNINYSGIWYLQESNYYMEIHNSGIVDMYKCSVNDGYVIDDRMSGSIDENELTIIAGGNPKIYLIEEDGSDVYISTDESSAPIERASEVPGICEGDAIEISYFSPEEASDGVETEFVVNFDYRLSSVDSAVIGIGFTSGNDGSFMLANGYGYEVSTQGTSSGSFTVNAVPVIFDNSSPYQFHVIMYEQAAEGEQPSSIVADSVTIQVLP